MLVSVSVHFAKAIEKSKPLYIFKISNKGSAEVNQITLALISDSCDLMYKRFLRSFSCVTFS